MTERIHNFSAGPAVLADSSVGGSAARYVGPSGRWHVGDGNQPSLKDV